MRKLEGEAQLSYKTIREADDVVVNLHQLAKAETGLLMAGGKKGRKTPSKAAVASAVIFHFGQLPLDVRLAILRDGLARLNAYVEGTPQPAPSDPAGNPLPHVSLEAFPMGPESAPAPKKKKRKA